jgi:hypothetical protein
MAWRVSAGTESGWKFAAPMARRVASEPSVCVTCVWAGVDNAWEQEKLEARKMPENAAESHTSGARFVSLLLTLENLLLFIIF